jgi:hypothetical protein
LKKQKRIRTGKAILQLSIRVIIDPTKRAIGTADQPILHLRQAHAIVAESMSPTDQAIMAQGTEAEFIQHIILNKDQSAIKVECSTKDRTWEKCTSQKARVGIMALENQIGSTMGIDAQANIISITEVRFATIFSLF